MSTIDHFAVFCLTKKVFYVYEIYTDEHERHKRAL